MNQQTKAILFIFAASIVQSVIGNSVLGIHHMGFYVLVGMLNGFVASQLFPTESSNEDTSTKVK